MVADLFLPLVVGIGAQPEHVVVNKTSAPERLSENHFLLWRGVKPEFICALDVHALHIKLVCVRMQAIRDGKSKPSHYLPGLKAEVSRRH